MKEHNLITTHCCPEFCSNTNSLAWLHGAVIVLLGSMYINWRRTRIFLYICTELKFTRHMGLLQQNIDKYWLALLISRKVRDFICISSIKAIEFLSCTSSNETSTKSAIALNQQSGLSPADISGQLFKWQFVTNLMGPPSSQKQFPIFRKHHDPTSAWRVVFTKKSIRLHSCVLDNPRILTFFISLLCAILPIFGIEHCFAVLIELCHSTQTKCVRIPPQGSHWFDNSLYRCAKRQWCSETFALQVLAIHLYMETKYMEKSLLNLSATSTLRRN